MTYRFLAFIAVFLLSCPAQPAAVGASNTLAGERYTWRNVSIGGGGYVTGIVAHPSKRDLVYARTDVGGAYRFSVRPDSLGRSWVPLLDGFGIADSNLYGIESIAVDANNPDVVYVAAGKYTWAGNGYVLKSTDRGMTWAKTGLALPMGANESLRWAGERLVVDPNNSDVVYFGSRADGLWRSLSGGRQWTKLARLSPGNAKGGIVFVALDPELRIGNKTPITAVVYAGVYGKGVLFSKDGGTTFSNIGGPKHPLRGVVARNGALYVSGKEGVFRYRRGSWEDISPHKGSAYCAISVHPRNPNIVVASEFQQKKNLPLYLSRNGGRSWRLLAAAAGTVLAKPNVPWWTSSFFAGATASLLIDPIVEGRLWLTEWSGVWFTDDYTSSVVTFRTSERGHEELVVLTLATPPSGAVLLSGAFDASGFRHEALDAFPERAFLDGNIWSTLGLDYMANDPDNIVRVGVKGEHGDKAIGGVALSTDNGRNWKRVNWPFSQPMRVAYSATDPNLFVIVPRNAAPQRTNDRGNTWEEGKGVADPAIVDYWGASQPLAADRNQGSTFYLYSTGKFYRSDDGGLTWQLRSKLPVSAHVYVEAEPNAASAVWVSLDEAGLYVSRDGGDSFMRVGSVHRARLFGLGRHKPYSNFPSLFLYGEVERKNGPDIYRSDDLGATWTDIGDPALPIGNEPLIMRGDQQNYRRVYIGTAGRGIFVGMPR